MRVLLLTVLIIISFHSYSSDQSVHERAHGAAWKAIQAKDAMKNGIEEGKANSVRDKIQKLIASGDFEVTKKSAVAVASKARSASLSSFNLPPDSNPKNAIERNLSAGKVFVFVSESMPEGQLQSLLKSLKNTNHNVEVVYRGLFTGNRTITQFTKQLGLKLRSYGVSSLKASIGLNPTVFREVGVNTVPAMAYIHSDRSISRITGIVNVDLFVEGLGEFGTDYGNDGSTYEIEEKDFFIELQERMAQVNWQNKISKAKEKYWDSVSPYNIPVSTEYSFKDVDMTVQVNSNIYAEYNGEKHVIARAGQKFNPLDQPLMNNFNRRLLAFNPNDERQLKWAKNQITEALKMDEKPVVMLTSLLVGNKSGTFSELESELTVQIYMLQDVVLQKFKFATIPTSIRRIDASSGSMRVSSFPCIGLGVCGE